MSLPLPLLPKSMQEDENARLQILGNGLQESHLEDMIISVYIQNGVLRLV
jgi:hypothetical protein